MDDFQDKYKRKNPFTVPEGYFDTMEEQVMERIKQEKQPQKINVFRMLKPYMGLAAIFLFALFIVQWVLPHFIDENKMLLKEGEIQIVVTQEGHTREIELDEDFNPTKEEIIEYLAQDTDMGEYFFDGIRWNN